MKRFCKGTKLHGSNIPLQQAPTPPQAALILPIISFSQKATISAKPLLRLLHPPPFGRWGVGDLVSSPLCPELPCYFRLPHLPPLVPVNKPSAMCYRFEFHQLGTQCSLLTLMQGGNSPMEGFQGRQAADSVSPGHGHCQLPHYL